MPIIPKIFPQSRTIAHPDPTPALSNHEHLGPTMITFSRNNHIFQQNHDRLSGKNPTFHLWPTEK